MKNLFFILILLFSADLWSAENSFCEKLEKVFGYTKTNHRYDEYHCGKIPYQYQNKKANVVFLHRDFFDVSTLDIAIVNDLENLRILANLDFKPKLGPFGMHYQNFDEKIIPLGKLGDAFVINSVLHGCGAGGSLCGDSYKNYFVVTDNKIHQVLSMQVAYSALYGGEWHEDGTRDHIPEDWSSTITFNKKVDPPQIVKTLNENKKKKQTYYFDLKTNEYRTKDKNIMNTVLDVR